MFTKKLPLSLVLLFMLIAIIVTYFVSVFFITKRQEAVENLNDQPLKFKQPDFVRMGGYEYINPILYLRDDAEAQNLMPLKSELEKLIISYKNTGVLTSGSIYIRQLNEGNYISINDTATYKLGSLIKVPEAITFMKMAEKYPSLLNETISYKSPVISEKDPLYNSKKIVAGKSYTIKELLHYMIAYSDNNAAALLFQRTDLDIFKKLFSDIGLKEPDLTKTGISLSAREYSLFMRVLYNGTYLNFKNSELCTNLLTDCDFNKGLVSGLPAGTKIAHKFSGEGDGIDSIFSETGIVYTNRNAYLITVMLKGKNDVQLPPITAEISKKTYKFLEQ